MIINASVWWWDWHCCSLESEWSKPPICIVCTNFVALSKPNDSVEWAGNAGSYTACYPDEATQYVLHATLGIAGRQSSPEPSRPTT